MGAGKWKQEYSATLKGKTVVICPDKDEPGQKHGNHVAEALKGVAREVFWLDLPEGKDVSEWIESTGATVEADLPIAWYSAICTGIGHTEQPRKWNN